MVARTARSHWIIMLSGAPAVPGLRCEIAQAGRIRSYNQGLTLRNRSLQVPGDFFKTGRGFSLEI